MISTPGLKPGAVDGAAGTRADRVPEASTEAPCWTSQVSERPSSPSTLMFSSRVKKGREAACSKALCYLDQRRTHGLFGDATHGHISEQGHLVRFAALLPTPEG